MDDFIELSQISLQCSPNRRVEALRATLLPSLWNLPPGTKLESSDAFLEYYMSQRILIEAHRLNIHTHQDLIDLINFIRARMTISRSELANDLRKYHESIGPPTPAVEVAVRIWLLVSIDDWEPEQTLQEYIHTLFPQAYDIPDDTALRSFPLSFNVATLQQIGGFDIVWTDCLDDHLSLTIEGKDKQLKLFHMASFLHGYPHSSSQIFPQGLLEETAQTISLLLPSSNLKCQKWLRKARTQETIDLEAGTLPATSRDLAHYAYWGRQLLELRDEYDRTEPTTVKQWIVDKRKPNQRYTFWIAVVALTLALVFGLIQSVTGILQVLQH